MSNRDGKKKHKRKAFRLDAVCPFCKKDKLVKCDQHNKEGHKHCAFCPTCKKANF